MLYEPIILYVDIILILLYHHDNIKRWNIFDTHKSLNNELKDVLQYY